MKGCFIYILSFLVGYGICEGQKTSSACDITIVNEQGSLLKARNNSQLTVTFRITYVTEGRNQAGELISSVKEQSEFLEIGPGEEIQVFTAPRDPRGKISYVFKNVVITECSTTKPSVNSRGINTRMNGGN